MKKWTVGQRINFGFACVILISAALGIFSFVKITTLSGAFEVITDKSIPVTEACFTLESNLKNGIQCVYQHVGSQSAADMKDLEEKKKASGAINTKCFAVLDERVKFPEGKALIEKAVHLREQYKKISEEVLTQSRKSTNDENKNLAYQMARDKMDPIANDYCASLHDLVNYCTSNNHTSSATIKSAIQTTRTGVIVGILLSILLAGTIAFVINQKGSAVLREIARVLSEGSNQVTSAATQVSESSQSLAEGASEQAASIEETSSSLEEMSSMTKGNADHTQKANDLAKLARAAAEHGVEDMKEMTLSMNGLKSASDDIAKIIKTIDEIAFQTNILALNAAVEAARAGEAGMGFAVVAEEVRSLAQRSAQAAKETSQKIESTIDKTTRGVTISHKVSEGLTDIVTRIRELDVLIAEIATASNEQSQGISQINTAVAQMDKVTQNNTANAEESAAAAEELSAQAQVMKESVNELLLLIDGAKAKLNTVTTTKMPAHKIHPVNVSVASAETIPPAKKQPAAHPQLASTTKKSELPLDDDFKDM